jgi:pimeloyl-ACP methyl ester carboxylesterase
MPSLPQSAISNYAEIDGARIWYAEWGKPSKTTPVLLLHGGFGNSNYFGNLIRFLVKHGYNVIAMDSLLQIGRSSSQKSFAIISFLRNTRWGW